MRTILRPLALVALLLVPSSVQAAIILDFTNASIYGGANGLSTFEVEDQGVTVTLTAFALGSATLYQGSAGIGINTGGGANDEIGFLEVLGIGLSPSVDVTGIAIQQLTAFQSGSYSFDLSSFGSFSSNGQLAVSGTNVENVFFLSGNLTGGIPLFLLTSAISDFSVSALQVELQQTTVPEPAVLLLLGVGLLAFAKYRNRRVA